MYTCIYYNLILLMFINHENFNFSFIPDVMNTSKLMNRIRLNQHDITSRHLDESSTNIQCQTWTTATSAKSIFSLGDINVQENPASQMAATALPVSEEEPEPFVATKKEPVVFNPKKFVPSQQTTSNFNMESILDDKQTDNKNGRIKPKWSPSVTTNIEDEPKYRKIQPILQNPKSPHKIT